MRAVVLYIHYCLSLRHRYTLNGGTVTEQLLYEPHAFTIATFALLVCRAVAVGDHRIRRVT